MAKVAKRVIKLQNVRFSYVFVDDKKVQVDSKGNIKENYSVQIIVPKGSKADETLTKAITEIIKETPIFINKVTKKPLNNLKLCKRDGDTDDKTAGIEDYANCWFFNATSNQKPGLIVGATKRPAEKGEIYSGCYGVAMLTIAGFDNPESKGVTAYLQHLWKTKEGDRLDGSISVDKAFDDLNDEDIEFDDANSNTNDDLI